MSHLSRLRGASVPERGMEGEREAKGKQALNEDMSPADSAGHDSSIPSTASAIEISRSRSLWTTWRANGSPCREGTLGGLRFA